MIELEGNTEQPEPRQEPKADRSPGYAEQPPTRPVGSDPLRRSPFLASILSFMPGVGQIYVGYYQLGFIHAIVFAGILALLASGDLGPLIPLLSVFLGFFWLYNVIDAGRRATLVNEALAGRGRFELPKDFTAPGLRGTVLGGSILVGVGLLILFRTLFGVSLAWVEDWWPVAIIAFGGYLIFKARSDANPGTAVSGDE
jgi:hypothetical protein